MPVKLQFTLHGEPPLHPYQHVTGLRAVVLRWIESVDPALSAMIHDANQSKPYTLSPLWQVSPHIFQFTVAVLADEILDPLLRGLALQPDEIRLGSRRFRMEQAETVVEASWQELLHPLDDVRQFEFRLHSPAAHHATGEFRKTIPLPTPELYFGSWLGRWNVCCETKIDAAIKEVIAERLVVAACKGETQAVRLDGQRTFIGFMGQVRFGIVHAQTLGLEEKQILTALARFGGFCGTGVDTMRGMGQTEYLEASSAR